MASLASSMSCGVYRSVISREWCRAWLRTLSRSVFALIRSVIPVSLSE